MADILSKIHGRKIIDSRGDWTIEIEIESKNGLNAKGAAPSGKSRSEYEAKVLDAEKSVGIANTVLQKIIGMPMNQESIDKELSRIDGTKSFSRIGGNTAIALSLAVYNALWQDKKRIFPYPLGNVIGGGAHGGGIDIQEVLVCPLKEKTFPDCVDSMINIHHALKKRLEKTGDVGINDEGALTPKISLEKALSIACDAAENNNCAVGIDGASSDLWDGKKYVYKKLGKKFDSGEHLDFMSDLSKTYNLFYVEDPFCENDFESFSEIRKRLGNKRFVCGDDLTATHPGRLKTAIEHRAINAAIAKPNQAGTVSLTHEFVSLAKKNKITPVISHRSGETMDSTISAISLDWQVPLIKAGVIDSRIAKLDRLLELWDECKKPRMVLFRSG